MKKTAIIAIGTELTTGQIINKNAAWLSAQIKKMGGLTSLHVTVPDEKSLILEALDWVAPRADLLFVTGGLGPTTDDFTRDVVSEWALLPLQYSDEAWQHIVDRLTSRNYPIQEMQKQQCYFPKGAQLFKNSQGTAYAFFLEAHGKKIWVLPGPPREIEAVWQDHLESQLEKIFFGQDKHLTKSWDTIGLGESQIAALTEPIIKGQWEVGYRVHPPYVEVKFSYLQSQSSVANEIISKLEAVLGPLTLARDGGDLWQEICKKIPSTVSLRIQDAATGSYLLHKINSGPKDFFQRSFSFELSGPLTQKSTPEKTALTTSKANFDLCLNLWPENEYTCTVEILTKKNGLLTSKKIEAPMKSPLMHERRQQYWAEMALMILNQTLTSTSLLSH